MIGSEPPCTVSFLFTTFPSIFLKKGRLEIGPELFIRDGCALFLEYRDYSRFERSMENVLCLCSGYIYVQRILCYCLGKQDILVAVLVATNTVGEVLFKITNFAGKNTAVKSCGLLYAL